MDDDNILSSFTRDLFDSIYNIDNDKLRFSKKRKIDEITYMVDERSIIYDSESDDEDGEHYISHMKNRIYKKYSLK